MEVLGSLAKLELENSLPLPWWHRAPIGLLNKTFVYIALVESKHRPVGDLILTVLDPHQWENMLKIDCFGPDEMGFISKVLSSILPLNISIAESVTLETGKKHHVSLICEPFGNEKLTKEQIEEKLKNGGITEFKIHNFFEHHPKILWHRKVQIDHGWVNNVKWKKQIERLYLKDADLVDLNRVVISADTTKRLIRYVFPKKGAISVEIEHADSPGALKEITNIFSKCNSNILSALLRRGGAYPGNAILVAVCEPLNSQSISQFTSSLDKELSTLDQSLRAEWKIADGEDMTHMIYPRHPDDFVTRVPEKLISDIKKYKKEIYGKGIPIFISMRFIRGIRRDLIVRTVKDTLLKIGYYPIEATPETGPLETSIIQILSKMWLSKGGIVLVAGADDQDGFSINLAHEAGFLQGQGKPLLFLVEEKSAKSMKGWSNVDGMVQARFPDDDAAFNEDNIDSIQTNIMKWLNNK